MPSELPPHPRLPPGYKPTGGTPYPVRDGDSWKKLADRWFMNVEELIYFNFKTLNPENINWYLHWRVGCKVRTRDGWNWMFSSSAKPGIIYRPPSRPIVFKDPIDEFNERMGSGTDLGKALKDADFSHNLTGDLHLALDLAEWAHVGIAVSGFELAELGLGGLVVELTGPAISLALVGMALGIGDMEAVDEIKTRNAYAGIAQGIMLGAAGEKAPFIKQYFVTPTRTDESNPNYPEQRKAFKNAYLKGLINGLVYGRKLTRQERLLLFKHLEFRLRPPLHPPGDFYMHKLWVQTPVGRRNYYLECAGAFLQENVSD
jgi:hypothetical protein